MAADMSKIALFVYHKNIDKIYPPEWVDKFRDSILGQTFQDFDIFEINYGDLGPRIFENSMYITKPLPTFVHAMNHLIDLTMSKGYEYFFNTNADDYYSVSRVATQLAFLKMGYDVVSSNFALVRDDKEDHRHTFHNMNLSDQLSKGHNIIGHPVVAFSRRFFEKCRYVPEEIPYEDMYLWRRALKAGMKFKILPDCLLWHRLHDNMVSAKTNDRRAIV